MISQIALFYAHQPGKPVPDRKAFHSWIAEQFFHLPFIVEWAEGDVYRSFAHLKAEVKATGVIRISRDHNRSLFDPRINLLFRAVHDSDHLYLGADFTLFGEILACKRFISRCRCRKTQQLLFSEIVGQACAAVYFGAFLPQKFVPFPPSLMEQALYSPERYFGTHSLYLSSTLNHPISTKSLTA